jgi:hypothetical protein
VTGEHSTRTVLAPMERERVPAQNFLQSLWQLRAEETRSLVEQVPDPEAKRIVLEIAQRCDRLSELTRVSSDCTKHGVSGEL